MKFLVSGADGYLGRHVVTALLELGSTVAVAVRPNSDYTRSGTTRVSADVLCADPDIFERTGRPDVCIHLAWEQGFVHNTPLHLENVSRHYNFLKHMLNGGLKHIVGIGTAHEIGPHLGPVNEN